MVVYITRKGIYEESSVNSVKCIMADREQKAGKIYAIIGSYHPFEHKFQFGGEELIFDGKATSLEGLPELLEKNISKGERIVGRLIDENGKFIDSGSFKECIFVTTRVDEILL